MFHYFQHFPPISHIKTRLTHCFKKKFGSFEGYAERLAGVCWSWQQLLWFLRAPVWGVCGEGLFQIGELEGCFSASGSGLLCFSEHCCIGVCCSKVHMDARALGFSAKLALLLHWLVLLMLWLIVVSDWECSTPICLTCPLSSTFVSAIRLHLCWHNTCFTLGIEHRAQHGHFSLCAQLPSVCTAADYGPWA